MVDTVGEMSETNNEHFTNEQLSNMPTAIDYVEKGALNRKYFPIFHFKCHDLKLSTVFRSYLRRKKSFSHNEGSKEEVYNIKEI